MRKLFLLILILFFFNCSSIREKKTITNNIGGTYFLQNNKLFQGLSNNNYSKIIFNKDGTYDLFKSEMLFCPVFEQCELASKGKWSLVTDNLIEITSENYYIKQKGFKYEISKENKFSQDSLYIQVVFGSDFHPVNLDFTFNYNINKSIKTNDTCIVLPKSKYLRQKTPINQISFCLNSNISGVEVYNGRILFNIFEKEFNTEKYNFITISLPYFNRCFFEFQPYYKEFILIKNKNIVIWKGNIWKKSKIK